CSNGSCLSVVLGKSISKKKTQESGYTPLPVYTPPVERVGSQKKNEETSSDSLVSDSEIISSSQNEFSEAESTDERQRLVDAMEKCGWVQAKAARILRLTPRQMGYALRKYNIEI